MPWINGIVNNTFIALPDGGIIDSKVILINIYLLGNINGFVKRMKLFGI